MKITRAASYAVQAVAYMASQKKNQPAASHLIAQKRGIPPRFLLKVLKPLVAARVLLSVKGPHGGYRLARPAHAISLLEILEAIEGPIRGPSPEDAPSSTNSIDKKLDKICAQSAEKIRAHLGGIMISELAA